MVPLEEQEVEPVLHEDDALRSAEAVVEIRKRKERRVRLAEPLPGEGRHQPRPVDLGRREQQFAQPVQEDVSTLVHPHRFALQPAEHRVR